jgi:hypothetical protein
MVLRLNEYLTHKQPICTGKLSLKLNMEGELCDYNDFIYEIPFNI